jgi:hypothetical protein
MIHEVKDPVAVTKNLLESLLIAYRYDATEGVLVMVFDYDEKAPGADRAFLRLHFEGVSKFKRIPGLFAELQRFTDSFSARETRAASVLQKVEINERARPMIIAFGFGHSFGGISFTCTGVAAHSRNTRATNRGGDRWDYFDFENGDPIDFHEPFA